VGIYICFGFFEGKCILVYLKDLSENVFSTIKNEVEEKINLRGCIILHLALDSKLYKPREQKSL